jgi:DNA-binding transcriptional MerR regulator
MPLSRSRDYMSIGEVLESVRSDFPDVSISKIRFLESEGLINPERTPSGYRKFYDGDIARLRYILSLQRDHFLPLRVIRERLAQVDSNGGAFAAPHLTASGPAPATGAAGADMTGVQLTRAELVDASGLTDMELRGLEDFGILQRPEGEHFDEADLVIATAAKRLLDHGIEPRHLRMYRQFAEREAAVFEQIVTPVALRRDADAANTAARSMRELMGLAQRLHDGVLRATLRGQL